MVSERLEIYKIKEFVDKIDGWLTDKEGKLLYNLAKKCTGKGAIVEIGSWKGKSTIWLGNGSKKGNKIKIYAIDPHTGSSEHKKKYGDVWTFKEFKKNIKNANINDVVIPIVRTSEQAAKKFGKSIELIFIDGAHEYNLVKLDFELWFPKVINGGIMAFHDSATAFFPGPKKVVEELIYKSRYFKNVNFVDTITFAEKVKQNSIKDTIRNRYILFLKNYPDFMQASIIMKVINVLNYILTLVKRAR